MPAMKEVLLQVDMDTTDAEVLFGLLDRSGTGEINIAEFIAGCNRIRGQAKSMDLMLVKRDLEKLVEALDSSRHLRLRAGDDLDSRRSGRGFGRGAQLLFPGLAEANTPSGRRTGRPRLCSAKLGDANPHP